MAAPKKAHSRAPRNDISAEYLRSALRYNRRTGIFTWRRRPHLPKKWNAKWAGKQAGHYRKKGGYLVVSIDKKHYLGHRLAILHATGKWPGPKIDHENRTPSDNRLRNLREAAHWQNLGNTGKRTNNTSGYIGVHWVARVKAWRAVIIVAGERLDLGYHSTAKKAGAIYKKTAIQLRGKFSGFSTH